MSKGNMLMSQARGKLGGFVYSVVNGQQVQRAYNNKPRNPQTAAQLYQRALFVDAVKFYTRGRRNLFQFAFEDRKRTESDYNAFMRANAKRGVVISKAAFELYDYPALGNWLMSKGTLQPIPVSLQAGTDSVVISMSKSVNTELTSVTTVGQVAQLLIDGVDFLEGDILTFVTITAGNPESEGIPSVNPTPMTIGTDWDIKQLMLTANSSQPLSDFGIVATIQGTTSKTLILRPNDTAIDTQIYGGTIIHSRNTSTGVRVSTQEIVNSDVTNSVIEAARARTYVDEAVESWRTTQQAPVISETIMQGNIAQSIAAEFDPGE